MRRKLTPVDFLNHAIAVGGGTTKLAALLADETGRSCTHATVGMWKRRGRLPAAWVIPVEKVTGVSRHNLSPDIYPTEA